MAFIIHLSSKLKGSSHLLPILPRVSNPNFTFPFLRRPWCCHSASQNIHTTEQSSPLISYLNHHFHENSDFEKKDDKLRSGSGFFSGDAKPGIIEDLFSNHDSSPDCNYYERCNFMAEKTQHVFHSSSSFPMPKRHHVKDSFPLPYVSSDHYPDEISDFESELTEPCCDSELQGIIRILSQTKRFSSKEDALNFLRQSGVQPSSSLVYAAIWSTRDHWKSAFLAFIWGRECDSISLEAWNLMVWILGKQRKFDIAWRLVRDMHRSSVGTREALLIMMNRYAAANEPGKAIKTFQAMEMFNLTADSDAFYSLLRALCMHKNIEEAEEFMLQSKNLFPLEAESFNIILNGWCNIIVDVIEAKRVWREMSNCCITPDTTSYALMISCFSKVGNLFDSLRLYDEMKKRGWVPGLAVYNCLIYVLMKENCAKEAHNLLDKIIEMGIKPDSSTYNSIIFPLCGAQKLEEARLAYNDMMMKGLCPTVGTYHALLEVENTVGTLKLMKRMREVGCGPNSLTFLIVLRKFFRWDLPEKALKMWTEMKRHRVDPNSDHYCVLIQGLASCGWLNKAREFFVEMKSRGFPDDPKLQKQLNELEAKYPNHRGSNGNHKKRNDHGLSKKATTLGIKTRRPVKKSFDQTKDESDKSEEDEQIEIGRMIKHLGFKEA